MQVNVGKSITIEVDHAALPQAALDHVIMIGLRNVLMDSHASITTEEFPDATEREDAARAMVDKKLSALMRGEVRVQNTREGDPVRAEAMRMANEALKAKIKAAGKALKDYDPKSLRDAAAKLITPELLAKAKARVDETKSADVDLSDLGL